MHVAIFTSRATCTLQLTSSSLKRGLERWQSIWDHSIAAIYGVDYQLVGFYRTAPEYCSMGHIMLRAYASGQSHATSVALDTDTMAPINELLKHFSELGIG